MDLAVGSGGSNIVFTYMLDQHTNTWINNGNHSVPGVLEGGSSVAIQNDVLVATLSDVEKHPDVCGFVYKLTTTNNDDDNNNTNCCKDGASQERTPHCTYLNERERGD